MCSKPFLPYNTVASEEAGKKLLSGLQLELAAAGKRVEALEAEQQRGTVREAGLKEDLERMTKEYHALVQQKCRRYTMYVTCGGNYAVCGHCYSYVAHHRVKCVYGQVHNWLA